MAASTSMANSEVRYDKGQLTITNIILDKIREITSKVPEVETFVNYHGKDHDVINVNARFKGLGDEWAPNDKTCILMLFSVFNDRIEKSRKFSLEKKVYSFEVPGFDPVKMMIDHMKEKMKTVFHYNSLYLNVFGRLRDVTEETERRWKEEKKSS